MANVIIPVASFYDTANGGACAVSIRYDDGSLEVNRLIIDNQTTHACRAGAVHRTTSNTVWVTCNAGQSRTYNVPAGYALALDPSDNSLSYGATEVYCQWPGGGG